MVVKKKKKKLLSRNASFIRKLLCKQALTTFVNTKWSLLDVFFFEKQSDGCFSGALHLSITHSCWEMDNIAFVQNFGCKYNTMLTYDVIFTMIVLYTLFVSVIIFLIKWIIFQKVFSIKVFFFIKLFCFLMIRSNFK